MSSFSEFRLKNGDDLAGVVIVENVGDERKTLVRGDVGRKGLAEGELPVDAVGNLDQSGGNGFGIDIAEQATLVGQGDETAHHIALPVAVVKRWIIVLLCNRCNLVLLDADHQGGVAVHRDAIKMCREGGRHGTGVGIERNLVESDAAILYIQTLGNQLCDGVFVECGGEGQPIAANHGSRGESQLLGPEKRGLVVGACYAPGIVRTVTLVTAEDDDIGMDVGDALQRPLDAVAEVSLARGGITVAFAGKFLNQQVGGRDKRVGIAFAQFVVECPTGRVVALVLLPVGLGDGEADGDVGTGGSDVFVAWETEFEGNGIAKTCAGAVVRGLVAVQVGFFDNHTELMQRIAAEIAYAAPQDDGVPFAVDVEPAMIEAQVEELHGILIVADEADTDADGRIAVAHVAPRAACRDVERFVCPFCSAERDARLDALLVGVAAVIGFSAREADAVGEGDVVPSFDQGRWLDVDGGEVLDIVQVLPQPHFERSEVFGRGEQDAKVTDGTERISACKAGVRPMAHEMVAVVLLLVRLDVYPSSSQ